METKSNILGIHADWQAISLCVLAASTFWLFNAMNDDHTADVSYPIEMIYNQEQLIPLEPVPEKVRFNASGFGWNLLRKTIKVNRKPIYINLEDISTARYITASDLLPIIKSQIGDVKINYLLQDTIFLKFDQLIEKRFPVYVDSSTISLVPGYKIVSPVKIQPDHIYLRGPATVINGIVDSFFVKVPEKNIDYKYEEDLKLQLDLSDNITVEPEEIEVEFDVAKFVQESIEISPVWKNFPKDSSIQAVQEKVLLTVLIRPEDKKKLPVYSLKASANYQQLNPEDSTVPIILLNKPSFIREYFFTPPGIKIKKKE